MQKFFAVVFLCMFFSVEAQVGRLTPIGGGAIGNRGALGNQGGFDQNGFDPQNRNQERSTKSTGKDSVAPVKDYKIITLLNDTIAVDTALSIKKYYRFNYLRKDNFGLLPFANEGQTYNVLKYNIKKPSVFPEFGFSAKHAAYLEKEDINYYSAPTPYTELYYRSVMKQGQNLDAFVTLNTSKELNFFVGYKGLRSLGKYINQLSSSGNFRMGASYSSPNKRYLMRTHFTAQDILNQENGGIRDLDLFESSVSPYNKRERLDVYFKDVETLLKGKRFFLNHQYQLNKATKNGLLLTHEFVYEDKRFNFSQLNINVQNDTILRFGSAYQDKIDNKTRYYQLSNKFGAAFQSDLLGRFEFFTDLLKYDYHYNSLAIQNGGGNGEQRVIPSGITKDIVLLGGKYLYRKDKWRANLLLSTSLGDDQTSNLEGSLRYDWNEEVSVNFGYQKLNKMANLNYQLYQSDYVYYNWHNDFKNEKYNSFDVSVETPWVTLSGNYSIIDDKLYFSNDRKLLNEFGLPIQLVTTPKQFNGTINYLSLQLQKEFKVGRFALDNTVLYQNVEQSENILNVPQFLTRNTLYYTDAFFDKALHFQTGVTFSYFSKYYANGYNPLIGDFYMQDQVKIGGYPVFDFFINMKIRTAQIYINLEHFNSSMTGYNFYSAPSYPYRDFTFRFGLIWNFFS